MVLEVVSRKGNLVLGRYFCPEGEIAITEKVRRFCALSYSSRQIETIPALSGLTLKTPRGDRGLFLLEVAE